MNNERQMVNDEVGKKKFVPGLYRYMGEATPYSALSRRRNKPPLPHSICTNLPYLRRAKIVLLKAKGEQERLPSLKLPTQGKKASFEP